MTDFTTLDQGGAGLSSADTAELNKWDILYPALKENADLRAAIMRIEAEVAALHRSLQWRTLLVAVAFAVGFLLCSLLGAVAVLP